MTLRSNDLVNSCTDQLIMVLFAGILIVNPMSLFLGIIDHVAIIAQFSSLSSRITQSFCVNIHEIIPASFVVREVMRRPILSFP